MRQAPDEVAGGDANFHVLTAALDDAVVTLDVTGVILGANEACHRIFGWAPAELLGQSVSVLIPNTGDGGVETGERRRGRHRDGRALDLEIRLAENSRDQTVIAILRDHTAHRAAARRLDAEHTVTRILSETSSLEDAVPRILAALASPLELAMCELWLMGEGEVLRLSGQWTCPEPAVVEFAAGTRSLTFAPGVGLPGMVWSTAQTRFGRQATSPSEDELTARARAAGLRGVMALPVLAGTWAIGALVCLSFDERDPDPELLATMAALGRQIGQFVERRRTEEALRTDEARLALLARQAPVLIYTTDRSLRITSTGGRLMTQMGLTPAQMVGQRPFDEVTPAGAPLPPEARACHERALLGETVSYGITDHGLDLDVRIEPLRDPRDRITGVVGVALDATEVSRTDKTLRAIAQAISTATGKGFFRALVEHLTRELHMDCAVVADVIPGTGTARTIAAWLDGRPFGPIEYKLEGTPCQTLFTRGVCSYPKDVGRLFPDDVMIRDLNMVSYAGTPLFDGEGRPLGLIAVLGRRPLAAATTAESVLRIFAARAASELERKQADEALRESEERYRVLFEDSPSPLFLVDPDNERILAANRAAMAAYGYSAVELLCMRLPDLLVPGIAETAAGVQKHHRRDGAALDVELSSHEVRIGGRGARIVGVHDVTQKRLLEREVIQAQKMEAVGQLAGGVAHDFNNLLTAILTISELALGEQLPDGLDEDMRQIHDAAARGSNLTRQLLAFSRRQVLRPTLVNLNDIVSELSRMLRKLIGEDIELVLRLEPELRLTKVDPGQIEQVIVNLALNAREAMPHGGRLEIETGNAGEHIRMTILDSGRGMEPEVLARAFEPFFSTKGRAGSGLGLSTAYGIIRQSNGHISARSEPGKGATFEIFLPHAPGDPIRRRLPGSLAAVGGTETVLLVEDDESVRRITRRILLSFGYRVLDYANPLDALQLIEKNGETLDLLLTDVVMPQMGGRELAEKATSIRRGLRVLFMSGYTDDTVMRHGLHDGVKAFLGKPFSADTLVRKVREVLDTKAELPAG